MTTDYHAFYLSTASSRIIVFFTHSTSPDVGLTLFRNPSFIGLCIDDTYFPWYTQPLPSAVPPSLAAVLHISVACRSFGGRGWPEVIFELLWICGHDEVEVIIDETRRRRRDSRILVDAWHGHDTRTRPGAELEVLYLPALNERCASAHFACL